MECSAFLWDDAKIWAHKNDSFDMLLSYLGPASSILTASVSPGFAVRSGCSLVAARWQVFFVSFLSSFRANQLSLGGASTHR